MRVGDLVVRTYGEGQRPTAIIVGWYTPISEEVIWLGTNKVELFAKKHLKVISEYR